MNNTVNVSGQHLKAALKFVAPGMSTEVTRYYLRTVYFDKKANKPLYLVFCDGHRIHKIALECQVKEAAEFNFLMNNDAVKNLIKTIDKREAFILTFEELQVSLNIDGNDRGAWRACDGKFPDYERVMPKGEERASLGAYKSKYLADAFAAFSSLDKSIAVGSYGAGETGTPILLKAETGKFDALIVIMPMRV